MGDAGTGWPIIEDWIALISVSVGADRPTQPEGVDEIVVLNANIGISRSGKEKLLAFEGVLLFGYSIFAISGSKWKMIPRQQDLFCNQWQAVITLFSSRYSFPWKHHGISNSRLTVMIVEATAEPRDSLQDKRARNFLSRALC